MFLFPVLIESKSVPCSNSSGLVLGRHVPAFRVCLLNAPKPCSVEKQGHEDSSGIKDHAATPTLRPCFYWNSKGYVHL